MWPDACCYRHISARVKLLGNEKNIASNNYEELNGSIVDTILPGLIHDTKGRVAKHFGITTGHASIFTTGQELVTFLKSFLEASLLKKETIEMMLKHQERNQMNYDNLKKVVEVCDINKCMRMLEKKKFLLK